MVYHGFWFVPMVFQGGLIVFHGFWLVSMVFQAGFIVYHGFGLVCWLRTPQNCILAQQSSLGQLWPSDDDASLSSCLCLSGESMQQVEIG